jgi:hypothetical protein
MVDNLYPERRSDETRIIDKYHELIKESIKANIEKFNFQIKFLEPEYVIKMIAGGFDGQFEQVRLINIGTSPFGVLSVEKIRRKVVPEFMFGATAVAMVIIVI